MRPSPIFSVFNSPYTRPQGRMDPRGRRGTSADIVHALLRYRSKTTKIQKLSIDSYSNKNFISPFFRPRRPLTPKGEKTSETRVRPHAKFGENRRTGCREIADQTKKEKQQVRQNWHKPAIRIRHSFFTGTVFTGFLQGVQGRWKWYVCCLRGSIFSGCWDIGDVKARNDRKDVNFSKFLILRVETALPPGWLCAVMCACLCPTYSAALDDAQNKQKR